MTALHEAAQQALEALELHAEQYPHMQKGYTVDAIEVLRAALAEPLDPVAGVVLNEEGRPALVEHGQEDWHCANRKARRLYTHPAPQRQPLTDEKIVEIALSTPIGGANFARAIERAHGIGGKE